MACSAACGVLAHGCPCLQRTPIRIVRRLRRWPTNEKRVGGGPAKGAGTVIGGMLLSSNLLDSVW